MLLVLELCIQTEWKAKLLLGGPVNVGCFMIFASYGWDNCSDAQTLNEDLRLAEIAADSVFDVLWSTEHHFCDYSFIPDNLQLMTHLAAKTLI